MNRLRGQEVRAAAAATTAAIVGMVGLSGCSDILGGNAAPQTVSEAKVHQAEGRIIQPALLKMAGQAIKFWHRHKNQKFDPKNDAYVLKDGPNDYSLTITTQRGGRYYDINTELHNPNKASTVFDINVQSASDPKDEFGIDFDLSTKPWSASVTNYYTDYTTKKKKMHFFGDSTDNYHPGFADVDGYDDFLKVDADQILKVARQSAKAAEHAVTAALADKHSR
jgi:hypothetical protein